jgi:hypothetical protein
MGSGAGNGSGIGTGSGGGISIGSTFPGREADRLLGATTGFSTGRSIGTDFISGAENLKSAIETNGLKTDCAVSNLGE